MPSRNLNGVFPQRPKTHHHFLSHLRPALKRERAKRKAEGHPDAESGGRAKAKAKGKAKSTPAAKAKK